MACLILTGHVVKLRPAISFGELRAQVESTVEALAAHRKFLGGSRLPGVAVTRLPGGRALVRAGGGAGGSGRARRRRHSSTCSLGSADDGPPSDRKIGVEVRERERAQ